MDEELNEDEVEERLYAMLHYAAEPESDQGSMQEELARAVQAAPTSTMRRYWRVGEAAPTAYQRLNYTTIAPHNNNNKSNIPLNSQRDDKIYTAQPINVNKTNTPSNSQKDDKNNTEQPNHNSKNNSSLNRVDNSNKSIQPTLKEDSKACKDEPDDFDMMIFQSPISKETQVTVQIIDENPVTIVNLESSDEDEVVEVALPPKPTITIESSDDEVTVQTSKNGKNGNKKSIDINKDREISTSPVPSVVSSVSDDFIRGDCITLNISSKKPACQSFDFSLHGTDLVETPAKKKKKKNRVMSTPVSTTEITNVTLEKTAPSLDSCFATPKSKSKKKQKNKSFTVAELSVPHTDIYDSDSNNSTDVTKTLSFTVSDKTCPNADVYESDSSQSAIFITADPAPSTSFNKIVTAASKSSDRRKDSQTLSKNTTITTSRKNSFVDLTGDIIPCEDVEIEENIVMANVTGFQESDEQSDQGEPPRNVTQLASTRVPKILSEDLDFDFLKGNVSGNRKRRYSVQNLREEMDKFYNESWGGEDFNHKEIQKAMSRDRSLWQIDIKDKMPTPSSRKPTCNYCGRVGHRDDTCYQKPATCHLCGRKGHLGTRCPSKICVNCGSPNHIFSVSCRHCSGWQRVKCVSCRRAGHPAPHCPDLWRRYHSTVDNNVPLESAPGLKPSGQQHCSACARRGHLAHACRAALPFGGLPVNAPQVSSYEPIYPPDQASPSESYREVPDLPTILPRGERKRGSRSPPRHDHAQKKRISESDKRNSESERRINEERPRRQSEAEAEKTRAQTQENVAHGSNTDKNGKVIQDNEVSDTSVSVTTARVYITEDVRERLRGEEGQAWLQARAASNNVTVQTQKLFLNVTGTLNNQEAFQAELRVWCTEETNQRAQTPPSPGSDIPKNRNNVMRQLSKALESLDEHVGDPNAMYKELKYLRGHREDLLKQKVVSPKQLANNREYTKAMVKKLNMVLLGQAGLGGGARHVAALRSLRCRLVSYRQKLLTPELRQEIGDHYSRVFAATPRDDYHILIENYYRNDPTRRTPKKKKSRPTFAVQGGMSACPAPRPAPAPPASLSAPGPPPPARARAGLLQQVLGQLDGCSRRLAQSRPAALAARRAKLQLSRKLYAHIKLVRARDAPVSSKQIKKMKKVVALAQHFLQSNV